MHRATAANVHPLIEGHAVRLLYDYEMVDDEETARRFSRALSAANGAHAVAQWLSGFLHGSGQLLFHYPPLWSLVNNWVAGLEWTDFEAILPLLRRTFADFSQFDRRRLLSLARGDTDDRKTPVTTTDKGAVAGAEKADEAEKQPTVAAAEADLVEALLGWMG